MTTDGDAIHIESLELSASVGVPEEERATPQRLTISITMWPSRNFSGLEDELTRTVNYAAVAREVHDLVGSRSDKLIETLAEAIAAHLLATFSITRVSLELRKFVLPGTAFVAVRLTRERSGS